MWRRPVPVKPETARATAADRHDVAQWLHGRVCSCTLFCSICHALNGIVVARPPPVPRVDAAGGVQAQSARPALRPNRRGAGGTAAPRVDSGSCGILRLDRPRGPRASVIAAPPLCLPRRIRKNKKIVHGSFASRSLLTCVRQVPTKRNAQRGTRRLARTDRLPLSPAACQPPDPPHLALSTVTCTPHSSPVPSSPNHTPSPSAPRPSTLPCMTHHRKTLVRVDWGGERRRASDGRQEQPGTTRAMPAETGALMQARPPPLGCCRPQTAAVAAATAPSRRRRLRAPPPPNRRGGRQPAEGAAGPTPGLRTARAFPALSDSGPLWLPPNGNDDGGGGRGRRWLGDSSAGCRKDGGSDASGGHRRGSEDSPVHCGGKR